MTKQPVTVRAATLTDITKLSHLWHEKIILYQQMDQRFRLLPDARQQWENSATQWLSDEKRMMLVAERADELFGFIIGLIEDAPPGLMPEKIGVITDLVVDAHSHQRGVGQVLLNELRAWFARQTIETVLARAYYRYAVEQAFWRAQGATEWIDLMWLK